ncbi:MAG: tetratricopeptide repeat protein [Planctomycetota bacterium]
MSRKYMVLVLAALLLSVCQGNLEPADDTNTYTSEKYGFSIKRPDSGWKFNEKPPREGTVFEFYIIDPSSRAFVLILVSPVIGQTDTAAYRDEKLAKMKGDPKYSNMKAGQKKIAREKAPGLAVETSDAQGTDWALSQFYLARNSYLYTVQCAAHRDQYKNFSSAFETALKSFSFIKVEKSRAPEGLAGLAGRCGGEVEWLTGWETVSKRASREKKLIIVTAQFYGGFSMQVVDFARVGPFMDPDFIELANERFLVMKLMKNSDVPFRSQDLYGFGPSTFGRALLFVTPDGRVIGDTFSYNPFHLYDYAREVLAAHPEYTGNPVEKKGNSLVRAEAHLKRGELEQAAGLLENALSYKGLRLKASLFRKQRRGEDALEALKAAYSKKKSGAQADFLTDEAYLLMRMGKTEEAAKRFSKVIEKHSKKASAPEAMFWLGACRGTENDGEDTKELWTELIESHPESRWAWMAAARLLLTKTAGARTFNPAWPDESELEAVRVRKLEPKSVLKIKEAEKEAISFLLKNQKADGSWFTPPELGGGSESSIPLRDAKNALCGASLLAYRDNREAVEAVESSVRFLLRAHDEKKKRGPVQYYMDYSCWSDAYMLMFFAQCYKAGIGKKSAVKTAIKELLQNLEETQRPGGGWSYLLSFNLAESARPDDKSISFVTAGVTLALIEAKKNGAAVPDAMLKKALDCIANMRNPNGSFTYFFDHRNPAARDSNLPGSSGRVPLCELALYRGKRGSLDRIRGGLDIFARYRHNLSRQQGKALMHTGTHGQGSHYLLFDYSNAAAAVSELPESEREKFRNILHELVLGTRVTNGSYLDNPIMGHCCGTAMALLSFQYLH